jgi:hypothetical protein
LGGYGVFKKIKLPRHTNTRDSWRRNCPWDQREGFLEMKMSLGKLLTFGRKMSMGKKDDNAPCKKVNISSKVGCSSLT